MPTLLLPNVSPDLIAQLNARARANNRTPEAEHVAILQHALTTNPDHLFETLAAGMRALTAGTPQTPSEHLLRLMRDER